MEIDKVMIEMHKISNAVKKFVMHSMHRRRKKRRCMQKSIEEGPLLGSHWDYKES